MWVLTIFEKNSFRIFEFDTKEEALITSQKFDLPAIISYTNLTLVA